MRSIGFVDWKWSEKMASPHWNCCRRQSAQVGDSFTGQCNAIRHFNFSLYYDYAVHGSFEDESGAAHWHLPSIPEMGNALLGPLEYGNNTRSIRPFYLPTIVDVRLLADNERYRILNTKWMSISCVHGYTLSYALLTKIIENCRRIMCINALGKCSFIKIFKIHIYHFHQVIGRAQYWVIMQFFQLQRF